MSTQLIGGPLDSALIAEGARPVFIWCTGAQQMGGVPRARTFKEPGTKRALYRLEDGGNYIYAGDHFRRCAGCGAFGERDVAACGLCGHDHRAAC